MFGYNYEEQAGRLCIGNARNIWLHFGFRRGQSRSLSSGFDIGTLFGAENTMNIERAKGVCHGQDYILAFRPKTTVLSTLL